MSKPDDLEEVIAETTEKLEEVPEAHIFSWIWRLAVLGIAAIAQPDTVSGTLTAWGLSFWAVFFVTVVVANSELIYYFLFWKWAAREAAKKAAKKALHNKEV